MDPVQCQLMVLDESMFVLVFAVACIALLWVILVLAISPFFRGMALVAIGAIFINIASRDNYPIWLVVLGVAFILFPAVTLFRRSLFGE